MKKKIKFVVIILLCFICNMYSQELPYVGYCTDLSNMVRAKVSRVIDGDTIELYILDKYDELNKIEKVRLLGVDTPETKHPTKKVQYFGKEAYQYTKRNIEKKNVFLLFDRTIRDRYGRLLCYVYMDNGTLFNLQLIAEGYAYAYTKYQIHYDKEFINAQHYAKRNKKGLWN